MTATGFAVITKPENNPSADPVFGEYVVVYTRAQAIDDDVLVDVTKVCNELGIPLPFKHHVAMTTIAWSEFVDWTDKASCPGPLQMAIMARLCAVFRATVDAARNAQPGATSISFTVVHLRQTAWRPVAGQLVLHCGPGDSGEPVLTYMLPGED